jgi:hypothetical protein
MQGRMQAPSIAKVKAHIITRLDDKLRQHLGLSFSITYIKFMRRKYLHNLRLEPN